MMYGVCFGAGALMMLVSILLVGICRSKGNERQEEGEPDRVENGTRGKREFETVCAVMHLIRCGKVKASTPNWQVYSEVKKWKEVSDEKGNR